MIKSQKKQYDCPAINDSVIITLHYIEDRKRDVKSEAKMEDCDSVKKCGVQNSSGSFEWTRCQIFHQTVNEIF